MNFLGRQPPPPRRRRIEEVMPVPRPEPAEPVERQFDERARAIIDLKVGLHRRLLEVINLSALDKMNQSQAEQEIGQVLLNLINQQPLALNSTEKSDVISEVVNEVLGLGPIEPLLKDETVSDILINTHELVFVERFGRIETTDVRFKDQRHLLRILNKIVSTVGRRVDESQPMVDARLLDGSRVNAVIPPVAVDGPLVSIRKFAKQPFTMDLLVDIGTLTHSMAEFFRATVRAKRNTLISGGTGTGKTTLLNAMSSDIEGTERIVTIEDAAELQLQQVHVARMETRPPNIEGRGEIAQRELVKNALRMRPDRIIVGEVRAGEAFDMLQAMNTGHEGSMTTIHANSCRDALSRLEQMLGMTGMELPIRTMRGQIATALHIVVQLERMSDGRRRIVSVQEVTGIEGDIVSMQEIFRFRRLSTDTSGQIHGRFESTGIRPKLMGELESRGFHLSPDMFRPEHILE